MNGDLIYLSRILGITLILALTPLKANALLIGPADMFRADFDLSGATPSGPYTSMALDLAFAVGLPAGESFTVNVFDYDGGPSVGNYIRNGPIGSGTLAFFLSTPSLADGIGHLILDVSVPIAISRMNVQVHNVHGNTVFVESVLSVVPRSVPEPASLAMIVIGLASIGLADKRRRLGRPR